MGLWGAGSPVVVDLLGEFMRKFPACSRQIVFFDSRVTATGFLDNDPKL
jgi:hypothetical protein